MKSYSPFLLFIFRLFVLVFIGWVCDLINYYISGNIAGQTGEFELTKLRFYSAIFIAPIFETFIFWMGPILLLKKYISTPHRFLIYFLFSIIWAYWHYYNVVYTISLLLMALFYWSIWEKDTWSKWKYFFYISSLHSLYNLIVSITNYGLLEKFDVLFK
jgi:hypothetical protein